MIIKINEGTPQERKIGEYNPETNQFYKEVKMSKHLFKKMNAWGIDGQFFENVLVVNDTLVEVYDKENETTYFVKAKKMKAKGQYYHFKGKEDHRPQIFLPLRYWDSNKESQTVRELRELKGEKETTKQDKLNI